MPMKAMITRKVICPGVFPDCRDQAQPDAKEDSKYDAQGRQFNGGGQAAADVFADRLAGFDGRAQVALQQVAEVGQVLFMQGFIQAPFFAKGGDGVFIVEGVGRQVGDGGVGRDEIGDEESHHGDAQQKRCHQAGHGV